MNYTISKKVNIDFQQAIKDVTAELQKEGFGIITEVDLKEKFKDKLKVDFRNYTILGACNPALPIGAIENKELQDLAQEVSEKLQAGQPYIVSRRISCALRFLLITVITNADPDLLFISAMNLH